MRRTAFLIASVILYLSLANSIFAVDEDRYVEFAADSTITLYKFKGDPRAMELWMEEMGKRYPDYMNQDWQAFGERLTKDKPFRDRVYNRILEKVRAQGYRARMIDLGSGVTTIEIED